MLLDACGRRRWSATLPSFHRGRPPRNKGQRYPAVPPPVEEISAMMHAAGEDNQAVRLRGLIIALWRPVDLAVRAYVVGAAHGVANALALKAQLTRGVGATVMVGRPVVLPPSCHA